MSRIGYLYLPQFLINLVQSQQPDLQGRPLLLHREGRLLTMSPELRGLVMPGMPISQARGRCPEALIAEVAAGSADVACAGWLNALAQVATAVEPVGEEAAFFVPGDFYGRSTQQVLQTSLNSWGALIGVGGSKMAARLAAHSQLSPMAKSRITKIIVIKAGEEEIFIRRFRLTEDIFLPAAALQGLAAVGINTFAQAQQLSLPDLQALLGELAYGVYLHCRGKDRLPVISSYPPGEIVVGYTCLPEELIDVTRLQRWIKSGVRMLTARLKEQNQGCRRLILSLRAAGKIVKLERTLATGRQEETSLQLIFRLLADQLGCPEGIDHIRLQASELYPLSFREQDLFAPRAIKTETEGIWAAREALALKYPGVFAAPVISYHREAALAQCDPWRCPSQTFLGGERGV